MKVREITGNGNWDSKQYLFGLEFEVESHKRWIFDGLDMNKWDVKNDASLRHEAIEVISRGPIPENSDRAALVESVCQWINKGKPIKNSPRTSVHVHYNCGDKQVLQVYNLAMAYWIVEDLMYDYFGANRKNSPFCVPVSASEQYLEALTTSMTPMYRNNPFQVFHPDYYKYSGLNLCPLNQFNTVEFRGLGGVYNPVIINAWLETIKVIDAFSLRFKNPSELLDYAYKKNPSELLDEIIPKGMFFNYVLQKTEAKQKSISNSVCLLTEAAYNTKWKEIEPEDLKKVKNKGPKFQLEANDMVVRDFLFDDLPHEGDDR